MRVRGRVDANQRALVREVRQLGYSVLLLSAVGHGCPDLLVGSPSLNLLVEVKRPVGPQGGVSGRTLTDDELNFAAAWKGPRIEASDSGTIHAAMIARRR